MAVLDNDQQRLLEEINAHEHLWVHSWLVDDAYQKPAEAWAAIKTQL